MASSAKMVTVGIGAAAFIFSSMVLYFVYDPIMSTVIPIMQLYTPAGQWQNLSIQITTWLIPMIWFVITISAILALVRVMVTAGEDVTYESDW